MTTVYIAGPMRGIPHFNFPAFDAKKAELTGMGYKVISPADLDREVGIDGDTDLDHLSAEETRKVLNGCILRDVHAIAERCDLLYVLKGWETSKGCAVEIALAKFLGMGIIYE
jgi:hypothetical protein